MVNLIISYQWELQRTQKIKILRLSSNVQMIDENISMLLGSITALDKSAIFTVMLRMLMHKCACLQSTVEIMLHLVLAY